MAFDFGALGGLLGDIGDAAAQGATGYRKVKDAIDGVDKETDQAMKTVEPTYTANVSPGDVFAIPNMYLFGGGAALLLIILFMRGR